MKDFSKKKKKEKKIFSYKNIKKGGNIRPFKVNTILNLVNDTSNFENNISNTSINFLLQAALNSNGELILEDSIDIMLLGKWSAFNNQKSMIIFGLISSMISILGLTGFIKYKNLQKIKMLQNQLMKEKAFQQQKLEKERQEEQEKREYNELIKEEEELSNYLDENNEEEGEDGNDDEDDEDNSILDILFNLALYVIPVVLLFLTYQACDKGIKDGKFEFFEDIEVSPNSNKEGKDKEKSSTEFVSHNFIGKCINKGFEKLKILYGSAEDLFNMIDEKINEFMKGKGGKSGGANKYKKKSKNLRGIFLKKKKKVSFKKKYVKKKISFKKKYVKKKQFTGGDYRNFKDKAGEYYENFYGFFKDKGGYIWDKTSILKDKIGEIIYFILENLVQILKISIVGSVKLFACFITLIVSCIIGIFANIFTNLDSIGSNLIKLLGIVITAIWSSGVEGRDLLGDKTRQNIQNRIGTQVDKVGNEVEKVIDETTKLFNDEEEDTSKFEGLSKEELKKLQKKMKEDILAKKKKKVFSKHKYNLEEESLETPQKYEYMEGGFINSFIKAKTTFITAYNGNIIPPDMIRTVFQDKDIFYINGDSYSFLKSNNLIANKNALSFIQRIQKVKKIVIKDINENKLSNCSLDLNNSFLITPDGENINYFLISINDQLDIPVTLKDSQLLLNGNTICNNVEGETIQVPFNDYINQMPNDYYKNTHLIPIESITKNELPETNRISEKLFKRNRNYSEMNEQTTNIVKNIITKI